MARHYEFVRGERSIVAKADIHRVGDELMRLANEQHDEFGLPNTTPEAVVEFAKDKRTACHRYIFLHDDATAAHLQRLETARALLRSVRVVIEEADGKKTTAPAFVAVRFDDEGMADPDDDGGQFPSSDDTKERMEKRRRYVPIEEAMARDDTRESVLSVARRSLQGWVKRYESIAGMAKAAAAVQKAIDLIPKEASKKDQAA